MMRRNSVAGAELAANDVMVVKRAIGQRHCGGPPHPDKLKSRTNENVCRKSETTEQL